MNFIRKKWLWRVGKRFAADPIRRTITKISGCGKVPLFWCSEQNWGDALNPILVKMISERPARQTAAGYCDRYMAIGSILGNAYSRTVVWGSGFIMEGESVQEPPKAIHAVRGPLTRAALLKAGINCPEVYGDPALLLPHFFNPDVQKQFEIGIIPHFVDKSHPWIQRHQKNPDVRVIDVQGDIWEFVRAVKSCKVILSSSLHGLICADAYGVPNAWIQLSKQVCGGDFKFRDYRLSIGAGEPPALAVSVETPLEALVPMAELHKLKIDLPKLLLACPFLSSKLRAEVEAAKPASCGLPERLTVA
jgi:pyruvyltransferase